MTRFTRGTTTVETGMRFWDDVPHRFSNDVGVMSAPQTPTDIIDDAPSERVTSERS